MCAPCTGRHGRGCTLETMLGTKSPCASSTPTRTDFLARGVGSDHLLTEFGEIPGESPTLQDPKRERASAENGSFSTEHHPFRRAWLLLKRPQESCNRIALKRYTKCLSWCGMSQVKAKQVLVMRLRASSVWRRVRPASRQRAAPVIRIRVPSAWINGQQTDSGHALVQSWVHPDIQAPLSGNCSSVKPYHSHR